MMASMCHPGTNGVSGSMMGQVWRTNSRRFRVASSRSTFARALGFANQEAKLLEFFIGQFRKFGRGTDYDGTASGTTVFVAEVILVAQKILGQENVGRRVSLVGQAPQVAAKRYPSSGFAALHGFGKVRM